MILLIKKKFTNILRRYKFWFLICFFSFFNLNQLYLESGQFFIIFSLYNLIHAVEAGNLFRTFFSKNGWPLKKII